MRMGRTTACFACATSLAFASMQVCASTLFRCVAQDGAIAYQDVPCGGDSVLTRTIPIMVEAGAGEFAPKKKQASRKGTTDSGGHRAGASRSVRGERAQRRDACRAAREAREAALARMGLRRTFEQLRALDDRVHDACKGL